MVDDLMETWEQLGHMLADVGENFTDMHPDDVAKVLRNCELKATELTQQIAGRRKYVEDIRTLWENTQSGNDAGMPPGPDILRLFVPRPGSATAAQIDPGSAIVGVDTGEPTILVDYEGNRHNAVNLRRYWQRAAQAAGRHLSRYPTIARSRVPREDLIPVGWFDGASQEITLDAPGEALAAWLGLTRQGLPGETVRQVPGQEPPSIT
jgi:hypothetical protein